MPYDLVHELPGFNRLKIRVLFYNNKGEYVHYMNIVDSGGNNVFSPNPCSPSNLGFQESSCFSSFSLNCLSFNLKFHIYK